MLIHLTRSVAAPADRVFSTVSDIREFARAVPAVVRYELLSREPLTVGSRFREIRRRRGRPVVTELEIRGWDPPSRVRLVASNDGTVWDTTYSLTPHGDMTVLELEMRSSTRSLPKRLFFRLIRRLIRRAVARDLDAVCGYCEAMASGEADIAPAPGAG